MVSVIRPFGELVVKPFEVRHTSSELSQLVSLLKKAWRVNQESFWNTRDGIMNQRPRCSMMPGFLSVQPIRC